MLSLCKLTQKLPSESTVIRIKTVKDMEFWPVRCVPTYTNEVSEDAKGKDGPSVVLNPHNSVRLSNSMRDQLLEGFCQKRSSLCCTNNLEVKSEDAQMRSAVGYIETKLRLPARNEACPARNGKLPRYREVNGGSQACRLRMQGNVDVVQVLPRLLRSTQIALHCLSSTKVKMD